MNAWDLLLALAPLGLVRQRPAPRRRSINTVNRDLKAITDDAWGVVKAANNPPTLFRFGGVVSRIETDDSGNPFVQTVTPDRMRHRLANVAKWGTGSRSSASPPADVVRNVLATPNPDLPVLRAVVQVPTFAPDGSLLTQPGYHQGSQTFYAPPPGFHLPPIPDRPTSADLDRARHLIVDELLGDFPFEGEAERAHAVGLLLLPFVRNLIEGPTPLHLIEKPKPGTGGTLLAETIAHVALGRKVATMTEGRDEEEWRRRITSKLRDPSRFVLIDNVRQRLESAHLAAAITSSVWEDRLIGSSEMLRLRVECVWVATGNNPSLTDEMMRRSVRIRLDAKCAEPWLRQEFRHPDLPEWVASHRTALVASALTMVKAWVAAGRPLASTTLGMFERWSQVVGGILEVGRVPGFLGNLADFYQTVDLEDQAWRDFLGLWWGQDQDKKVTVAAVFKIAEGMNPPLDLGVGDASRRKIRLGKRLASMRDRQYEIESGGQTLSVRLADDGKVNNTRIWRLRQV